MARVKDTMKFIESSIGRINPLYDMLAQNIDDIYRASSDSFDMICNGFRFGYMQGMKAARTKVRK